MPYLINKSASVIPPYIEEGFSVKSSRFIHRLRNAVIFAAARGAATAIGSGLIGLIFWWITHH
jgi:hypothetical protein